MKRLVGLASVPAAGSANGAQCAPCGKTFQGSSSWAFGPPINYEKFMKGIPLTLNLELFRPDQRVVPSNIESAPGYFEGEIQGFLT
jgi:hypothetical protein